MGGQEERLAGQWDLKGDFQFAPAEAEIRKQFRVSPCPVEEVIRISRGWGGLPEKQQDRARGSVDQVEGVLHASLSSAGCASCEPQP